MTDESTIPAKEPRPSPINGPAFFVFGMLFVVLGLSRDGAIPLALGGFGLLLVGIAGIAWQRHYEKAAGIEDVLPGKSPSREPIDSTDE